ncbi:MAG: T9SS type A sorting domain-containing protein [Bacteroidia bacterium]|nr:T9SS type A sorting domain-containing protein [Bacteroidia bacterium]
MEKQNPFINTFQSFLKSSEVQFLQFKIGIIFLTVFILSTTAAWAANTVETYAPTGSTQTWNCPAGVTSITVECWGGGGAGGGAKSNLAANYALGGGGSGGGYALKVITVTPGTPYSLFVGAGGVSTVPASDGVAAASGGASFFINATTVNANGGVGGIGKSTTASGSIYGAGGVFSATNQVGTTKYNGGNGVIGTGSNTGGGGGSAGTVSNGNVGINAPNAQATAAVTGGGTGGAPYNAVNRDGYAGGAPGGGGGGAKAGGTSLSRLGGNGGAGKITITYVNPDPTVIASATSLTGFSYLYGAGPSTSQQTNISGTNLTGFPADLTVTAPTDYEVSTNNSSFAASVTIAYTSATLASTPIYVRLKSGLAPGNYNAENVAITGGGLATTYNIACSGSVVGTYTWSGGASGSWTTAANWAPTRTTPAASDQLTFDGGGSIVVTDVPAAQTIGQLLLSNNTALELQAAANAVITIGGATGTDLDVPAGSTLTLGGSAYTIKLALSTGATGTVGGNVTFSGSSSGTGLNHQITSADAAGVTFASGAIMTAGANFTGVPFGTTPNGAVIFSTASTYIHASGGTPFGGANAVNVATFNTGSLYKYTGVEGTVGTVVTAKPAVAAKTYGNYEVNTAATISSANPAGNFSYENITVNGTSFAISGNTSGATATIKGNVTIGTGGGITFGIGSAVSPVIFGGSSPQTITLTDNGFFTIGAGSVMSVNNDLTLDGDITLSGTVNVATGKTLTIAAGKTLTMAAGSTLTIASGATLSIPSGATLTVAATGKLTNNGTITNSGTLNVQSSASGTATVLNTGTITGSATVNQYLTTGRNWYISNPVAAVAPTVASGTITLYNYDETLVSDPTGWTTTTNPLAIGKGYVAAVSADGNTTFTGTLNDGNQNITLSSRTGTANKAGFNLIGNPYPSFLDWDLVTANTANAALLRSTTMWYRTKKLNQASELVYQFWTVNGDGVSVPNGASAKIPPMQAFWVRANEGGGTLALTNTMRSHAPVSDNLLKALTVTTTANPLVRLQVSNGINTDEAVIYFSANASNGLDRNDSPKMFENKAEVPEIYTTVGTEKMVINGMNSVPLDTPIGLGFVAGNAGTFNIVAKEITNLPEGIKVILKDNVTLAETDLADGSSSYQFKPEVTSTDRFSVIFRSAGSVTAIGKAKDNAIQAYSNAHQHITVINNKNGESTISVYNAVGKKLVTKQMTGVCMQLDGEFTPGVYVVKVNDVIQKVIVK